MSYICNCIFKPIIRNKEKIFPYLFWISLFAIIIAIYFMTQVGNDKWFLDHIKHLHAASLILLTFFILWTAYSQLFRMSKTSKCQFLLEIDSLYRKEEILEAKILIRQYFCEAKKNLHDHPEKIEEEISKMIRKLAQEENKDEKSSREYMVLVNFLDFLETIAFYANRKIINNKELVELMGGSIIRYYMIFEGLITYIRQNRSALNDFNSQYFYCELENFYTKNLA